MSAGLIAWSIFNMLSITATQPLFPAPNSGPPIDIDPVSVCRVHFLNGEQLPIRSFDLQMGKIVYVAGSPTMAAKLRELMLSA